MADSLESRLSFILDGQQHCDHFLTPLADPRGKDVLVVGVGAGTEMLWCLRGGARHVTGIDILEQTPDALEAAAERLGISIAGKYAIEQLAIEDAARLGRRFDLVVSNNVFEHIGDLEAAFRACAALVVPATGRIAIFTDPLYHSSAGSHLQLEPWEHIWGDREATRRRLLAAGSAPAALERMTLDRYLSDEITLNGMRLGDLVAAVGRSGLAILNLKIVRDRSIPRLGEFRARMPDISATDLAIEGIGIELAQIESGEVGESMPSTEEALLARRFAELESEIARLHSLLRAVEASTSFRLGRRLTAPLRWIRDRLG